MFFIVVSWFTICARAYQGYWTFWPVQPKVYLTPKLEINWIVRDKFTVEVWVENITKMKDIYLDIRWDWRLHSRTLKNGTWDGAWLQMLNTSKAAITINNEVFPKANRTTDILQVNLGQWDGSKVFDQIILNIVMDCKFPLINGTFKVMDIVFTKLDPWYCGRQPKYIPPEKGEHNWVPENASTPIYIYSGYLSVLCLDPCNIYFGKNPEICEYWHVPADLTDINIFNDVEADVWKYTYKDKVAFLVHILSTGPHYGAGFAFSTTYTFGSTSTFQVWFAEYSDNKWHYQTYGTGWNGPVKTEGDPDWPAGIEYWRSADGTWYVVTIPISYLGGAGKTYWWATQFRTNLLGTFPSGINLWAQTNCALFEEEETMCLALYADAMYIFMPVPGDLDGNGHVDIVDLSLIAGFYGTKKEPYYTYYDLNGDCTIDIFDIVIVAKNFCRTSPF
jgi:hypothetical protein